MECTTIKIFKSDLRKLKKIRRILEEDQERDLYLQEVLSEVIKAYKEVKSIAKQHPSDNE